MSTGATALAISQEPLTFASITDSQSSTDWSLIRPTLFIPEATSMPSIPPKVSTAPAMIASASASVSGRRATMVLQPLSSGSARSSSSTSALVPARVTLAPAAPSALAASEPMAPEAPVTITDLPSMENRFAGSTTARPPVRKARAGMWPGGSSPASNAPTGPGRRVQSARQAVWPPGQPLAAGLIGPRGKAHPSRNATA